MMIPATIGLLIAATVPSALQGRADEAGLAYVQCLFGVVRESGAAGLSQSAFEQRLATSCRAERNIERALSVRVLKLRGSADPADQSDSLDRQMRQGMIDDYRTLPHKQRSLRRIETLCTANPQECR
jgi:hypothetical protein